MSNNRVDFQLICNHDTIELWMEMHTHGIISIKKSILVLYHSMSHSILIDEHFVIAVFVLPNASMLIFK